MASTGPITPASFSSDGSNGGANPWASPSNAGVSDNSYTTSHLPEDGQLSEYLICLDIGDLIPAGATIDGFEIKVEVSQTGTTEENSVVTRVRMIKGGVVSGTQLQTGFTLQTDTIKTFGGPTNKFGLTWVDTDPNADNFGVAVSAILEGTDTIVQIDHVTINVFYTIPPTYTVPIDTGAFILTRNDIDIVYPFDVPGDEAAFNKYALNYLLMT